jgi:hypothetical protein|tara:strand:+ start:2086 stop:2652 length:567 start_codon:yes stop_codon:yes gene_type:complete
MIIGIADELSQQWIKLMKLSPIFILLVSVVFSLNVRASPPNVQTPSPVIYLADNLDEPDKLGWCIDTKGRGFSERLHAHSCKPQGGDVQFTFDAENGLIKSVTFNNKCLSKLNANLKTNFGLLECKLGSALQTFKYIKSNQEFRSMNNDNNCIVVGKNSRNAGPFMSRDLFLQQCDSIEPKFKKWVIK